MLDIPCSTVLYIAPGWERHTQWYRNLLAIRP